MAGSQRVLVLTDVAGSTRLWADHPDVMLGVMTRHHRIVHDAIDAHGGVRPIDQGEGDAVFAAFPSAIDAVSAVLAFQRALEEERWPEDVVLRDRVGVHVGDVVEHDGNLFGAPVSATARIRSLGAGGQVLVSGEVLELVRDRLAPEVRTTDLGTHRLRDIGEPLAIHQLVGPGMPSTFPPISPSERRQVVLPTPRSSFVGREDEIAQLVAALRVERLVTLTGFGGMGKTRTAVETAQAIAAEDDRSSVRFADLSGVDRVESIGAAVADALGIDEGIDGPLDAVLRWIRARRLLLVLDNLEQLLPGAGAVVARLLDASADLRILATSREPLRLVGEHVFALDPLETPPSATADQRGWTPEDLEALGRFASIRLLVARATAARRGFVLTADNAQAVAAICLRLDGAPLALELVAVRLRVLSPQALVSQLDRALRGTGEGIRDLPARQRTLRATIEWSERTLPPAQRRLLLRLSVFPGSFTAASAEAICAVAPEEDVVSGVAELVERSLVRVHAADGMDPDDRFDLLAPIREYAAERLAEEEPDGTTADRHAEHFVRAARVAADGTREDQAALAALVEADWHNLRAALDRMHERGSPTQELAVLPMLARALQHLGREGSAVALLRHGAEHLDPEDSGDVAVSVLTHLADIEYGADRGASAVPTLVRAHALVAENGSPALAVHLAVVNTLMQDPLRIDPGSFTRASDRLAAMADDGGSLPVWYLQDLWIPAGIIAGDPRADVLRARLLGSARGRERLRLQASIGTTLSWVGRPSEAEELLAGFVEERVRREAYPVDRVLPLMVLADIRVASGRATEAEVVLDAAAADVAEFDQPFEHAMIRVQRAAIDRASGDLDRAAARLESLLASPDAGEVEGATCFALWLLAVVDRERGRSAAAAMHLRAAWELARTVPDPYPGALCRLERCVELVDGDPVQAVVDLAAVIAHPAQEWVHFAVDYDVDALRAGLETVLGASAVARAVTEAAAAAPVLPEWV